MRFIQQNSLARRGKGREKAGMRSLPCERSGAQDNDAKLTWVPIVLPAQLVVCRVLVVYRQLIDGPRSRWWCFKASDALCLTAMVTIIIYIHHFFYSYLIFLLFVIIVEHG